MPSTSWKMSSAAIDTMDVTEQPERARGKKKQSFWNKLDNLDGAITLPGFERLSSLKHGKIRRIVWLVIIVAGTIFLCYHLQYRIQYYIEDPTVFSMHVIKSNELR